MEETLSFFFVAPSLFLELACGAASVLLTLPPPPPLFKRGAVSIVAVEVESKG
jgi:hypothetical protein